MNFYSNCTFQVDCNKLLKYVHYRIIRQIHLNLKSITEWMSEQTNACIVTTFSETNVSLMCKNFTLRTKCSYASIFKLIVIFSYVYFVKATPHKITFSSKVYKKAVIKLTGKS